MRSGYPPQTTGVPAGDVTVDGVAREATAVSTVREIGGGGVPGVRASAAAEGSVTFAQLKNADSQPAYSPWTRTGNWPPASGSQVEVSTGTALESFRTLTGVIDSSASGSDGVISSSIIDPIDRLHRRVNLISYLAAMPPVAEGGAYRRVGMSSDWIADIILRRCAYFTTPYMTAGMSGVNVPGTGSMIPERGEVTAAGRYGDPGSVAQFLGSTFGWGIYSADATYTPEGTIRASAGFTIGCLVGERHANLSTITVSEGAGAWLLRIRADQTIALEYNGAVVAQLWSGARRIEARITAGAVALVTDDGRQATGAHPAPSSVTTAPVSSVRLQVQPGSNISGVMVADMPAGWFLNYTLNAKITAGTDLTPALLASPRLTGRDALDALVEIADATCRAFWWDEDGVFQWVPGDVLLNRAPTLELTSRDSLIDLGWSEAITDTYSSVAVDHKVPAVTRSRTPNVLVWQGKGDSLDSGQVVEEIASPSTDEEWIQTQWSPRMVGEAWVDQHNLGRQSAWGGVLSDGTVTEWAQLTPGALTLSQQPIGNTAMKYTYTAGTLPSGKSLQLAFPNDDANTSMWRRWRNEKLPLIRAYGRVDWGDNSVTAGVGPASSGVFEHAGGKWLQGVSGEAPGRVASFLAEWLCAPRAKATGVQIVHDPRVQVGDIVTVRDEHAHGVTLTALVTRVEQSVSAGESDMALDLFVIDGGPAWRTLGEHDAAEAGTLANHDTQEAGESMGEHNADPLHRA